MGFNGVLTFSEFQAMCENFSFKLTPYEFASLMARYDHDKLGTIDYNEFCDKVYECDFSSVLDGGKVKVVGKGGEEVEFDVDAYLKKIKEEEKNISETMKMDETLKHFVESFVGRKYQLRKTFRQFFPNEDSEL